MTIQTFAPATGGQPADPDFYAGRSDAYDEHKAGATPETLEDRYDWMTDPTVAQTLAQLIPTAYLQGYRALIEDLRAERHFTCYMANVEYAAWLAAR